MAGSASIRIDGMVPGASQGLGETVADEIRSLGVEASLAADVAADFLARSPLARRDGVVSFAYRLQQERGLGATCSRAVAAVLLGVERLGAGHRFEDLQHELRDAGMDEATVLSAALDASRIHRAFTAARRDALDIFDATPGALDRSPAFTALGLGIGAVLVALLLHLLGIE